MSRKPGKGKRLRKGRRPGERGTYEERGRIAGPGKSEGEAKKKTGTPAGRKATLDLTDRFDKPSQLGRKPVNLDGEKKGRGGPKESTGTFNG